MSRAKAKIWARRIHAGAHTIDDVPNEYQDFVREVYLELYGEEIPE